VRPVAVLGALGAPQHIAFAGRRALVASGADGVVRLHRLDGELVDEARVPVGSYNVSFGDGAGRVADRRRDLEYGLHQLGCDARL